MKKASIIVVMAIAVCVWAGSSFAADGKDEAKAMIEEAMAFLKANGKEKTLAELNNKDGKFVKGEVYVVALDLAATMLAHPYNPKLVGKNLLDVPDPDGKMFRKDIVETAKTKGEGWVDFKYKNPTNNKVESKTCIVKKAEDIVFVCGIYK